MRVTAHLRSPTPFLASLDLHSWLQRIAFLSGGYEPDTVRFLSRVYAVSDGKGYILDVGANVGLLSVPLALTMGGAKLCVIAVDPVPDNLVALATNIALNSLESSITVIPVGLGDSPKTVDIYVEGNLSPGGGTGTANILPDGSTYECVRQQVEIKTVDDLWRDQILPRQCSVVKIDTDGYDLNVLRGALEFLRTERPVVFGEFMAPCLQWHGQSVADVKAFAAGQQYRSFARRGRSWTFSEAFREDSFVQDLLLVPEEMVPRFEWCLHPLV